MDIKTCKYREEMLDLREKLLSAEANRLNGAKTYTIEEVSERLQMIIARGFNGFSRIFFGR